ncbi:uncharacterized protein GGS25DRAFT_521075 [Hypoxylon fragiforme]|uniref:uncharacterized protein n=1 Tax=Hypoxylon fragiforme TaxID=63214 RepID=UPI0020C61C70|nr:uncharacterized protein GGS25DRAFT_521075 [Hypoxylon fragiforme]KAI2610268.1 hypothetical protein GGS25DRAFT_521075 [Hypoxylon fragiforme]
MSSLPAPENAVEKLFKEFISLGNNITTNKEREEKYQSDLKAFLESVGSSEQTHPDEPWLKEVVTRVLAQQNRLGSGLVFAEEMSPYVVKPTEQHWGIYQKLYAVCLRWAMWGRYRPSGLPDVYACIQRDARTLALVNPGARNLPEIPDFDLLPRIFAISPTCVRCGKFPMMFCDLCMHKTRGRFTIVDVYCSRACQVRHWAEHEPICTRRRKFIRSVILMKSFFDSIVTNIKSAKVGK